MDEPLPSPVITSKEPRPKWLMVPDPPPGAWEHWQVIGMGMADYEGWRLKCWPLFDVDVRRDKGQFTVAINGVPLGRGSTLEAVQQAAEAEIVRRVRAVRPIYQIILDRVKARSGAASG